MVVNELYCITDRETIMKLVSDVKKHREEATKLTPLQQVCVCVCVISSVITRLILMSFRM